MIFFIQRDGDFILILSSAVQPVFLFANIVSITNSLNSLFGYVTTNQLTWYTLGDVCTQYSVNLKRLSQYMAWCVITYF